jgi:hypothetical protein
VTCIFTASFPNRTSATNSSLWPAENGQILYYIKAFHVCKELKIVQVQILLTKILKLSHFTYHSINQWLKFFSKTGLVKY